MTLDAVQDRICAMTRERLVYELLHFEGGMRLDFTESFLERLSDDKLRHLLLAAYLHCRPRRMPQPD